MTQTQKLVLAKMAQKLIFYIAVIVILLSSVNTASKIKRDGVVGDGVTNPAGPVSGQNGDGPLQVLDKKNDKPTEKPGQTPVTDTNTKPPVTANTTDCEKAGNCTGSQWNNFYKTIKDNKGMLMRTFYVLIGVTSIVIIYFVIRAWRTRRRRSRSRKYGIITTRGSDMEMEPLENAMDEDEDMTVFEQNSNRHR